MDVTAEQLRSRYKSLQTEDLLALRIQGGLTEEAGLLLMEELRTRGAVDRKGAVLDDVAMAEAASRGTNHQMAPGSAAHFASLIAGVLVTGGIICFSYLAPFIWRSPADRVCQKHGYWYATEVGLSQIHCSSWIWGGD